MAPASIRPMINARGKSRSGFLNSDDKCVNASIPTNPQNMIARAVHSREKVISFAAGKVISAGLIAPFHRMAAISAIINPAIMACRLALELAPRDPINHSKPRVPSSPNKSCSLCQPNSAWPKPTAICKAAGKLTGMTDKNSQLITRCRRGPNAIPTKCATPPACGK